MDKKNLKWNFIFQYGYIVTNIINAMILLPLYVSFIDGVDLGLWLATGNVLTWITMSDPGIGDVLQQKIALLFGKNEFTEISKTIGSGLMASIATFVIAVIIGVIFYFFLDDVLGVNLSGSQDLKIAFLISILSTGLTLVTFSLAGINQGLLRARDVALSYISSNILYLLTNAAFLYMGYGLLSIAIGNAVRALYLAAYNLIVIQTARIKQDQLIIFSFSHFKKFIRIFSYTSVSKVISSFSNNLDLIILARFIPAPMITVFEINRRPVKMLQALIGRYSVALMPNISLALGSRKKTEIEFSIRQQFYIYVRFLFLFSLLSVLCYENLISFWINKRTYAGNLIMILLIANFFAALIGYFMSNMTYALGDIKNNSIVNVLKGLIMIIVVPLGAFFGGIAGVLMSTLVITITIDVVFFTYRLNKLGYLSWHSIQFNKLSTLMFVVVNLASALIIYLFFRHYFISNDFFQFILKGSLFSAVFVASLISTDKKIRNFFTTVKIFK